MHLDSWNFRQLHLHLGFGLCDLRACGYHLLCCDFRHFSEILDHSGYQSFGKRAQFVSAGRHHVVVHFHLPLRQQTQCSCVWRHESALRPVFHCHLCDHSHQDKSHRENIQQRNYQPAEGQVHQSQIPAVDRERHGVSGGVGSDWLAGGRPTWRTVRLSIAGSKCPGLCWVTKCFLSHTTLLPLPRVAVVHVLRVQNEENTRWIQWDEADRIHLLHHLCDMVGFHLNLPLHQHICEDSCDMLVSITERLRGAGMPLRAQGVRVSGDAREEH